MLLFLLPFLALIPVSFGTFPQPVYLSPSQLPSSLTLSFGIENYPEQGGKKHNFKYPLAAPTPSPVSAGPRASPSSVLRRPHHHHRRHRIRYHAIPPSPSTTGCDQNCAEPLTSAPFGSPCACVLPMKVRLLFSVSIYAIFPMVTALEIEVAAGTYLKQSQVAIIGANADGQNQERTVVDINLIPLGQKFDNTTAILIHQRFLQKKVPLSRTLFGDYDVMYIVYPGLPSSPSDNLSGEGPSGSIGNQQYPVSANFVGKDHKLSLPIIFVIGLSVFVLLVVCCAIVFLMVKCKKTGTPSNAVGPIFPPSPNKRSGIGSTLSSSPANSTSASVASAIPMSSVVLSVKTFSLSELEIATEKFNLKKVLGEGGFGRVYHGILEDGSQVAVKLLTRGNQNGDREFISEIEMLSRLHHRNLVKLIGICIEERTRCLVYELVPNGSVESHLHAADQNKGPLGWDARLKIALGAARGLAYLHEDSNPRVIHRDFKASNILLEEDFTPKVSDFGLAREATEGSRHISTRVMGTFGYVAPEYAMTGHLLVKSDVYSYGVVLLELLSGRKPVDMSQRPGQENLVTWARPLLVTREGLELLVDPSLGTSYDFNDMAKVAAIASACVHPEVIDRPFMGEVVQALKLIYKDFDACSQNESSARDSDFRVDFVPSDSSWWNAGGITPHLTYGQASSFITMEHSSGPLEELENRPFPFSDSVDCGVALPLKHGNRSGPLRTVRSQRSFYRLRGSMSEHGLLPPRRGWNNDGRGHESLF